MDNTDFTVIERPDIRVRRARVLSAVSDAVIATATNGKAVQFRTSPERCRQDSNGLASRYSYLAKRRGLKSHVLASADRKTIIVWMEEAK